MWGMSWNERWCPLFLVERALEDKERGCGGLFQVWLSGRSYKGDKDLAMQGGSVGEGLCGEFVAAGEIEQHG
ncbi:hypothetical protein Tco_0420009, partial [Tanacetum coccineum]